MKNPLASIKNRVSDIKGRTLLLVIIGVIALIVAGVFIFGGGQNIISPSSNKSSTIRVPNLESVPGVSKVNDQAYVELQQQANQQKAQQAIQTGRSAVATVTSDQYVNELSIPEPGFTNPPPQEQSLVEYQRLYQEQLRREEQRQQERLQQQSVQQEEAYQEAYEGLMAAQAKSLMSQWQPPAQNYIHVEEETNNRGGAGSGTEFGLPPLYKAGDIIFGVMETSVDSDEPGPVLAKVVSGPLAGSKLIGSFKRVEDQVFIEFSLLSAPDVNTSVPVKAVAIDPETARTALATNVDYHRLLRYGTLFASAFLQGVGEAVLAGIQPDFTVDGTSISVTNIQTTTKDQVLVGLGEVGTKLGEKLDPIFDKPPTVTVESGTAVGLLFLQDFSLQPGTTTATTMPANRIQVIDEGASLSNATQTSASTVTTQPTSTVTSQ